MKCDPQKHTGRGEKCFAPTFAPTNPQKRHRRSIRLKGYDYSQAGAYFITIVTQDRACLFGEVVDGEMRLNEAGRIAERCWRAIPDHFPHVRLDEFVIMPNHVHGILWIVDAMGTTVGAENVITVGAKNVNTVGAKNVKTTGAKNVITVGAKNVKTTGAKNVITVGAKNVKTIGAKNVITVGAKNFSPLPSSSPQQPLPHGTSKTIGSVVRGFKIGVTKWFRENNEVYTVWQRNYYEHIIRSEESLNRIRQYILDNPLRWAYDRENPVTTASEPEDVWAQ